MNEPLRSKIEERLEALNQRIATERDPAVIRAFTKDIIALESQIQKQTNKSNPKEV
jgi:hypothetical protein